MEINKSSSFEQAPVGNHIAICVRAIDLGTQRNEYKGEVKIMRQLLLTWELPNKLREDGQPFIISKFYTASLGDKATLTKDLLNWFGKLPEIPFNPKTLLGKACQITIIEKASNGKHAVSSVTGLPDGIKAPTEAHNPLISLSLDKGTFDEAVFEGLGNKLKEMIAVSKEYKALVDDTSDDADVTSDDIPF